MDTYSQLSEGSTGTVGEHRVTDARKMLKKRMIAADIGIRRITPSLPEIGPKKSCDLGALPI